MQAKDDNVLRKLWTMVLPIQIRGNRLMLSRDASMRLLAEYGKRAAWVKHCIAVADLASRLGYALESRYAIDWHYLCSKIYGNHDKGKL
jgi:hypothetical protein